MNMLNKTLWQHSRKAFSRNPMFTRNMLVLVFMYFMFGILALELLAFGFVFDKLLLEINPGSLAIHTFNSCVLYFLLGDFVIKFLFKKSQSMQIMPYLTLPLPKQKLFDYLLRKEFSNVWNLYMMFLIVPFSLMAITPYFGIIVALLYIVFFYLLCVGISLLVNILNNYIERSGWMMLAPIAIIAAIVGIGFLPGVDYMDMSMKAGEFFLEHTLIAAAIILLIFAALWFANRRLMNKQLYRDMDSAGEIAKAHTANLSFFDRFGKVGDFMALDLKLMMRSKRLKQSLYVGLFFIVYYFVMIFWAGDNPAFNNPFMLLFFTIFVTGSMGMIMGQYVFTSESAFFDGLMARNESLLPMLKAKYFLYAAYGVIVAIILALSTLFGSGLDLFYLFSALFFTIGPIFFIMFLNAIINKSYIDLTEGSAFSWKGTTGNNLVIVMIGMFVPLIMILIINGIFGIRVACYVMLITGLLFTLTCNQWLKWIYNQFLKRKYKNMEGFRSN